jgi:hypothetical protein
MAGYGVQCTTLEAIRAEQERKAMVIRVWERTRASIEDFDIGRPRRSVCAMCNSLRGYAREGLVEFRTFAEVCAVGCDTDEFRWCWPEVRDPQPTNVMPGSAEKVELLAARFRRGEEMHHEDDFAARDWD